MPLSVSYNIYILFQLYFNYQKWSLDLVNNNNTVLLKPERKKNMSYGRSYGVVS